MGAILGVIGSLITIYFGINALVKNRKLNKKTLADWTRRGIKVTL